MSVHFKEVFGYKFKNAGKVSAQKYKSEENELIVFRQVWEDGREDSYHFNPKSYHFNKNGVSADVWIAEFNRVMSEK